MIGNLGESGKRPGIFEGFEDVHDMFLGELCSSSFHDVDVGPQ